MEMSIRTVYFEKASQAANSLDKTSINSRKQLPTIQTVQTKKFVGK